MGLKIVAGPFIPYFKIRKQGIIHGEMRPFRICPDRAFFTQ